MDWYLLTLIAFLGFGTQDFLFKVAIVKKCSSFITTISFLATVAIISFLFALYSGINIVNILIILALANGILFALTTFSRLESLKKIEASRVFPIIRLSVVIVVVWALMFTGETLTVNSAIGIILSLIALYLLRGEK